MSLSQVNRSATVRTTTHKPTGDQYLVLQLDLNDGRAIVCRVLAYRGKAVTQVGSATSLPLADCTRPATVTRDAATLAKLWQSGVQAQARDAGRDVVIHKTRAGNYQATQLPTVAEAEAEAALVDALLPACRAVANTLGGGWGGRSDRAHRQLDKIQARTQDTVNDAQHRQLLRSIRNAQAQGDDALLDLAAQWDAAGLPNYAALALDCADGTDPADKPMPFAVGA